AKPMYVVYNDDYPSFAITSENRIPHWTLHHNRRATLPTRLAIVPRLRYHVAAVAGRKAGIFVNGRPLARAERLRHPAPQLEMMALTLGLQFVGVIDEIRLSNVARYSGHF